MVLWIRYTEAEMKTRNINHARNLLDRAVTILPRVDKLWYKYVYMEETLGNVAVGTQSSFLDHGTQTRLTPFPDIVMLTLTSTGYEASLRAMDELGT